MIYGLAAILPLLLFTFDATAEEFQIIGTKGGKDIVTVRVGKPVLSKQALPIFPGVSHRAGDFLYIPADVPHQPRNLSTTEPAIAIVARTDANEQESVVLYREGAE